MVATGVTIRKEQAEFFRAHPELNMSEIFRQALDEFLPRKYKDYRPATQ